MHKSTYYSHVCVSAVPDPGIRKCIPYNFYQVLTGWVGTVDWLIRTLFPLASRAQSASQSGDLAARSRRARTARTPDMCMRTLINIGAFILRVGFGAQYTIMIISNPQNSIGNYLRAYITLQSTTHSKCSPSTSKDFLSSLCRAPHYNYSIMGPKTL